MRFRSVTRLQLLRGFISFASWYFGRDRPTREMSPLRVLRSDIIVLSPSQVLLGFNSAFAERVAVTSLLGLNLEGRVMRVVIPTLEEIPLAVQENVRYVRFLGNYLSERVRIRCRLTVASFFAAVCLEPVCLRAGMSVSHGL